MNNIPVIVDLSIQMFADGNVQVGVKAGDKLAVFATLGKATEFLALKFKEAENNQIQVPPAELANRLLNNL